MRYMILCLLLLTVLLLTGCYSRPDCVSDGDCGIASECVAGKCMELGCIDSDGGKNFDVKGTTAGFDEPTEKYVKVEDFCDSETILKEYYCNGRYGEEAEYICPIACVGGACTDKPECLADGDCRGPYECEEGRCVELGCSDTDNGMVYDVKGQTGGWDEPTGKYVKVEDYCDSETSLKEYYCDGKFGREAEFVCPDRCINGECVQITTEGCFDSDGGKNYYLNGSVSVQEGAALQTYYDECRKFQGSILVKEWYCNGAIATWTEEKCFDYCIGGACQYVPEKCMFSAGTDCIDKAAIVDDTVSIALRNNIGFGLHVTYAKADLCEEAQVGIGTGGPYQDIAGQQVQNNEVFRIRFSDCTLPSSGLVTDRAIIRYVNNVSGLSHESEGELVMKIT